MTLARIKKGDEVIVLAGRERGKRGIVREVMPTKGKALVQDINISKRHMKPTGTARQAGIVDKEQPIQLSNLALVAPDGSVSVAASDIDFPNGCVVTPDGETLIVAETLGQRITAFRIGADGTLTDRHIFADLPRREPDGICLDADGAIWFADPLTSECVRVGQGGQVLDVVTTDQSCFACMLGGEDGRTLFMMTAAAPTASEQRTGHILVTEVAVPGAGLR